MEKEKRVGRMEIRKKEWQGRDRIEREDRRKREKVGKEREKEMME